jgi:hypothetical protein
MNRRKKVLSVVASALIFSIAGAGQAQAEEISVSVSTNNPFVDFSVSSISGGVYEVVALMTAAGDDPVLQLYSGDAPTSYNRQAQDANPANHIDENDDSGPASEFTNQYNAQLNGTATSGDYTIRVSSFDLWTNQASETATYIVRYTGFLSRGALRTKNNLRLDAPGTTTEKANVVSCTPGKYTFLNGGSTAETANIQSYVYTLLVNGKAVSTISSDGFKSVASHLFPTIAGNMAGTATLEGATWDLKGMSNYSAACQVYATQSGANTQSVTTEAHDAVALAAAAEAAAKVQASKNMIADWAASNHELAKKYRDQRLVAKP